MKPLSAHIIKKSIRHTALVAVALGMGACDPILDNEDDDCPVGLYVTFEYNHNIERADIFRDQVGSVTAYVYDEADKLVAWQTCENRPGNAPLKQHGYQMHFPDLPEGNYRLVAWAHQRSYDETLAEGANFVKSTVGKGSSVNDLQVRLDRTPASRATDEEPLARVDHQGLPLDTLWNGCNTHRVEVRKNRPSYDTLSLVRDTKMLTITLRHLDEDKQADIDADDYQLFIVDNNGQLGHDNRPLADEDIVYTPFHTWTTDFRDDQGNIVQRAAHFGIMTSRLMHHTDPEKNALLVVRSRETGKQVATINLPDCLAQGRNAVDYYRYSQQEFLDRENNYSLDFFLKGDSWQYIDLRISILSWSKRIQNVVL